MKYQWKIANSFDRIISRVIYLRNVPSTRIWVSGNIHRPKMSCEIATDSHISTCKVIIRGQWRDVLFIIAQTKIARILKLSSRCSSGDWEKSTKEEERDLLHYHSSLQTLFLISNFDLKRLCPVFWGKKFFFFSHRPRSNFFFHNSIAAFTQSTASKHVSLDADHLFNRN